MYVMLVGAYPFEDANDPRNFRKTIQRLMGVQYSFPANLPLSRECHDLMSKIFVANPSKRISLAMIKKHPWFMKNLPPELGEKEMAAILESRSSTMQPVDEIKRLIHEARTRPNQISTGSFNEDEYMDGEIDMETELLE